MSFSHPVYNRCIAAKQYQNAAAIRGCSVATIIAEQEAIEKSRAVLREAVASSVIVTKPDTFRSPERDPWAVDASQRLSRAGITQTALSKEMGLNRKAVSNALTGGHKAKAGWRESFEAALSRILAREGQNPAAFVAKVEKPPRPSVPASIIVPNYVREACEKAGIEPHLVYENCRRREVTHRRQHVMWLLHQRGWSYPKIGNALGGMNHATILHGVKAHEARIAKAEQGRACA